MFIENYGKYILVKQNKTNIVKEDEVKRHHISYSPSEKM